MYVVIFWFLLLLGVHFDHPGVHFKGIRSSLTFMVRKKDFSARGSLVRKTEISLTLAEKFTYAHGKLKKKDFSARGSFIKK